MSELSGLLAAWAAGALVMAVVMALAWLAQRITGQSGWADAFWSFGLGLSGVVAALFPFDGGLASRQWLVALLIALWGLRLGSHIALRSARAREEDARYAALRGRWGRAFQIKLFGFLMLQAAAAWVLLLGLLLAARNPSAGFGVQDAVGVLVWLAAIVGAGVADRQLSVFKANPANKGRICQRGLWSWSRHPNYAFEWLGWCAWPLFAIDLSGHWPWGWLALVAPAYMYWLLRHVSGVPPLEEHMRRTRPDEFAGYERRTSVFFPLPPRR